MQPVKNRIQMVRNVMATQNDFVLKLLPILVVPENKADRFRITYTIISNHRLNLWQGEGNNFNHLILIRVMSTGGREPICFI
jgi:hypothetical protein